MHDSPLEPRFKVFGRGHHYCNLPQSMILAYNSTRNNIIRALEWEKTSNKTFVNVWL